MTEAPRVLYVCAYCWDDAPEGCGRPDPSELRLTPSGHQVCRECVENGDLDELRPPPAGDDDDPAPLGWGDLRPLVAEPVVDTVARVLREEGAAPLPQRVMDRIALAATIAAIGVVRRWAEADAAEAAEDAAVTLASEQGDDP